MASKVGLSVMKDLAGEQRRERAQWIYNHYEDFKYLKSTGYRNISWTEKEQLENEEKTLLEIMAKSRFIQPNRRKDDAMESDHSESNSICESDSDDEDNDKKMENDKNMDNDTKMENDTNMDTDRHQNDENDDNDMDDDDMDDGVSISESEGLNV